MDGGWLYASIAERKRERGREKERERMWGRHPAPRMGIDQLHDAFRIYLVNHLVEHSSRYYSHTSIPISPGRSRERSVLVLKVLPYSTTSGQKKRMKGWTVLRIHPYVCKNEELRGSSGTLWVSYFSPSFFFFASKDTVIVRKWDQK